VVRINAGKLLVVNGRKLLDSVLTSLACVLVLIGIAAKVMAFLQGQWLNAGAVLIFYLMLFFLLIFRHSSQDVIKQPIHYVFALAGTFLPFCMQLNPDAPPQLLWLALPLELVGMVISIIALASLGRGFGIFAANRKIKTKGLYQYIRHPLYAGEGIWFLALVLHNFSVLNLVLFLVQTACQIKRIRDEEQLLINDPVYATYVSEVRYRLIPGVF
jgi:protein-S-isoprenylcysteine O-methyltransferase Ste14